MSIDTNRLLTKEKIRTQSVDDQTLWLSFRKGNDLAFSVLYNKYVHRLFNYGMHTCYDRNLVLDCLQELFTMLWAKREHLAEVQAVNFYLFKSFRRLLLNKLKQRRKFFLPLPDFNDKRFEITPSFEDSVILEQTTDLEHQRLQKAISTLTKRQREVILLKFYNALSYPEVATVMELHVDSVYNLLAKAIDALREQMKGTLFLLPFIFLFA